MTDPNERIAQIEADITEQLTPDIADWTALASELQIIKWDMLALTVPPEMRTTARRSAHLISARLSNELRATVLLIERGYALQALSNAAAILELAFTIVFIGTDAERAMRWSQHDSDDSFVDIYSAMLALFRLVGRPDSEVPLEYRNYTQLCTAKHGNPKMFRRLGIQIRDETQLVVYHGPYLAPEIIHTSRIALWFATRYMILGLTCFNNFHVDDAQAPPIAARLVACRETMTRLRDADVLIYETPAS